MTGMQSSVDWSASRGEGKKRKPKQPRQPKVTPTEVIIASDLEDLLYQEIYDVGCGSCSYRMFELEKLEILLKKHNNSQDIRRIMLGVLMWMMQDKPAVNKELVGAKIGEYGLSIFNFEDLMRVYRHMKCRCGSLISDVSLATMQILRNMIECDNPYTRIAIMCNDRIPGFDIEKLQDALMFQKSGTVIYVKDFPKNNPQIPPREQTFISYGMRKTDDNVAFYWKVSGKEFITKMIASEYYVNDQRDSTYDDLDYDDYDHIYNEGELMYITTMNLSEDVKGYIPERIQSLIKQFHPPA
jgi:hypothetical protein